MSDTWPINAAQGLYLHKTTRQIVTIIAIITTVIIIIIIGIPAFF
jgi:hypothetical protein